MKLYGNNFSFNSNKVRFAANAMGLKYDFENDGTKKTYMQSTAGWVKKAGKGWVIYLMPGHTKHDFETAEYGQIVENAVIWKP